MSQPYQARVGQHLQTRRILYSAIARDLVSVITLGIILICIHELAMPFKRGFNCDDETIRYPYKDSTISSAICYLTGNLVNIALIITLEYLNHPGTINQQTNNLSQSGESNEIYDNKSSNKNYVKNVYCRLIVWLFGAITSELLTDIAKFNAGRLRPHFIDVCKPMIGGKDYYQYCKETNYPYEYITNYLCTGDLDKQRDARLSFLSGHSSYSAYSATFAVIYIQQAIDVNRFGLWKPALQVLLISMAFYTGLSRISDYKHHWQDVLAGLLLGTLVASFILKYVWPSFFKTYAKHLNKNSSSERTDPQEAPSAELNRLGY